MATEPKVTGLSPMTGPPGTKITVRGDNLGLNSDDIIKLTINGADCLPYLEWKSTKKIITRCSRALGSGDVVITTNSGGLGTCDVQFNCQEEIVGPTDESSVWVEELDNQSMQRNDITIPGSKEEFSADLSSPRFKPHLYVLKHYSSANLNELDALNKLMKEDLANKSNPETFTNDSNRAAMMKLHLPVIMECLQILEHLSKVITISRDTSVDNIVKAIKETLSKTHEHFDPLLAQKDHVQSVESAMEVFRQNETLFNLPAAIEASIKTRNYDTVVKEISSVLIRLDTIDIDPTLKQTIRDDVTSKVEKLKETIRSQLHELSQSSVINRNIEEVKRLVSHLNRLKKPDEEASYDLWAPMIQMSESLIQDLNREHDTYLKLALEENLVEEGSRRQAITRSSTGNIATSETNNSTSQEKLDEQPPAVVRFVQSAISIINNTYYDIIALGQAYFDPKDEFACKESEAVRHQKSLEFEAGMVVAPIPLLVNLLRSSLDPDSRKLDKPSAWPSNETQNYVDCLKHVLQTVIACYNRLNKVSLPQNARPSIDDFKEFLFELRIRSMKILFANATKINKNLHRQENWEITVDDSYGGRTNLPFIFEKNVIDTLKFANEVVFKPGLPDEKSILKRIDVQGPMKESVQRLINSFIDSLDGYYLTDSDTSGEQAKPDRMLLACIDPNQLPPEQTNRLLVTICNCQFTRDVVFRKLQEEFSRIIHEPRNLNMDRVFELCSEKYTNFIRKCSEKFCRIKREEIEERLRKDSKLSPGMESLQLELMIVTSQIFLIAPQLVDSLMSSIVALVQATANSNLQERSSRVERL